MANECPLICIQGALEREHALGTNNEGAAAAVMQYIRTGDYDEALCPSARSTTPLHHATVLSVAVTFQINGLGRLSFERFRKSLGHDLWATDEFAGILQQAYAAPSEGLSDTPACGLIRATVVEIATPHAAELMAPGQAFFPFQQVVRSTPELGFDLLQAIVASPGSMSEIARHSAGAHLASSQLALRLPARAPVSRISQRETTMQTSRNRPSAEGPTPTEPTAQPAPTSRAALSTSQPSRKRKRESDASFVDPCKRQDRGCAMCGAKFLTHLPWSRDNIYSRQCRTCADQLERRENFDEFDFFGRRLF